MKKMMEEKMRIRMKMIFDQMAVLLFYSSLVCFYLVCLWENRMPADLLMKLQKHLKPTLVLVYPKTLLVLSGCPPSLVISGVRWPVLVVTEPASFLGGPASSPP